ncbi:helix-turn-helix domain-containing protein [Vallitalea guaymasensis]|uniref:helix-turn-helix domain-containing protein n=1 Tax=Vallitalea guaymasensis TaxID=1185412 RepID=UPI000DE35A7C|nr:helix-turn-helix transcriptional regulator [Vallitalea guaymasensis]
MVNISKLKGKIVERDLSVEKLAEIMEINKSTLYRKMANNGVDLSIDEINDIIKALNLSVDDVISIFFTQLIA